MSDGPDASIIRVWLHGQDQPLTFDGSVWEFKWLPGALCIGRGGPDWDSPVRCTYYPAERIAKVETDWAITGAPNPRVLTQAEYEAKFSGGRAPHDRPARGDNPT